MKVQHDNGKKRTRGFSKKNPDHSKMAKMYRKSRFSGLCSKMALTILMKFIVEVVLVSIFQPAKTVFPKKNLVLDILRINLNRSAGAMIPWGNVSLDSCGNI